MQIEDIRVCETVKNWRIFCAQNMIEAFNDNVDGSNGDAVTKECYD